MDNLKISTLDHFGRLPKKMKVENKIDYDAERKKV